MLPLIHKKAHAMMSVNVTRYYNERAELNQSVNFGKFGETMEDDEGRMKSR